jgi:glycosyltransferase involved in cell wall biosynthesis
LEEGVDGLLLDDPKDAIAFATMIRRRYQDQAFTSHLRKRPANAAPQYTWERNGRELAEIFEEIFRRKLGFAARTPTQEL